MAAATSAQDMRTKFAYDEWMESRGVPVHRGYFVRDVRALELSWWEQRKCDAAFIQLAGQEGVSEARVTEIKPGETLPAYKLAIDEVVYVVSGRGVTNVWSDEAPTPRSFEWQDHAMFLIPNNHQRQFANMQGDKTVRLLHYSYLPLAMSVVPDPDFFLDNPYTPAGESKQDFYSEAKIVSEGGEGLRWGNNAQRKRAYWYGNFFPDMRAWDKLQDLQHRGAGGKSVTIQFAGSDMSCHMSVFPPGTYKKAHRHGPGRVIVIPGGEGYSLMWQEGEERVIVPWQEAALFVPPTRWFHQHFNLGSEPARYLALHPPVQFYGHAEKVEDRVKDTIEYVKEDPWVRQYFESELANRGNRSLMPEEAYTDPNYVWEMRV
ncbi:MAG TPA: cupin domain-containing protein [Chloroflexota bacterium]|nr:cupin domain-containing protein [Chloroflexota bacterium]